MLTCLFQTCLRSHSPARLQLLFYCCRELLIKPKSKLLSLLHQQQPFPNTSLVSRSVSLSLSLCRTVCTRVLRCSTPPSILPGSKTPPLSCFSTRLTSWLTKSRPLTCRNTFPASQVSCWPAVYSEDRTNNKRYNSCCRRVLKSTVKRQRDDLKQTFIEPVLI